jgi:DUF438 domain-containing protein
VSEFLGKAQKSQFDGQFPDGHPVRVYLEENILIRDLIEQLIHINVQEDFENFEKVFMKLSSVEKHFARKENQLFPYLEKYGWTSPSQGMWSFHDQIRENIKLVKIALENKDIIDICNIFQTVTVELEQIMQVEEKRLLPRAMELLSVDDWKEFREGDTEIGWMFDNPPTSYPEPEYIHPKDDTKKRKLPFTLEDKTHFDEGYLTPQQVNNIFKYLPVDITYTDENDRVVFYNRGDERIFPRSAGIIGREVKFCHPPKSVGQVLRILSEFKKGTRDVAEFWIQFKEKFIHIRYFAVREDGVYKGVIEMSQDVTEIKILEGQKRLLEWD